MDGSIVKMVLSQKTRVFLVERVFNRADENTDVCRNDPESHVTHRKGVSRRQSDKFRETVVDTPRPVRRQVLTQDK
jgi:hypothetical protein